MALETGLACALAIVVATSMGLTACALLLRARDGDA